MAATNFKVVKFPETSHEGGGDLVREEDVRFDYDLVQDQHGEYAVGAALQRFSLEYANSSDAKIELAFGREEVGVEVFDIRGRSARVRLTTRLRPVSGNAPAFRFYSAAHVLVIGVVGTA